MGETPQGLYKVGDTWLHRLHPLTKLVFSLAAIVVIFTGPADWLSAITPGLLAFTILMSADLGGRAVLAVVRLLAPFILIVFTIHGFFNPENKTVLLEVGLLSIGKEGLIYAAGISTRLVSALTCSFLMVFSTQPSHLIQSLVEAGLPRGLSYLLGSPLLLLPQLSDRIRSIQSAQQSRGLETQGSLLTRIKALIPLLSPLIFSSLIDVEERSLALEVRGFTAPARKTFLNKQTDNQLQRTIRIVLVFLGITLVVLGIMGY